MMPQQRRDRIREDSAAHHVLIAEDNPYRLLGFEGQTARATRADDENVVYLGSASKMFTPGLRVGWTVDPDSLATILGLQSEAPVLNPRSSLRKWSPGASRSTTGVPCCTANGPRP